MRDTIINKLTEIEAAKDIKMLFALESGSRGWEFPSPDSDYDVRFIYIKPFDQYLSVSEREDMLSFPINDELDIYGWDLRKVLQLVLKSNTTPFEWLQSPIIYKEEPGFKDALWALCQNYYSQRSNAHHYLCIASGAMDTITNGDEIKIKKLFYVLRPLFSAKWCIEKNTIAPMTIGPLMTLLPADIRQMVADLVKQKETAAEGFIIKIDPALRGYIDSEFAHCNEASKDLKKDKFDIAELDKFFIKTIKQYDY